MNVQDKGWQVSTSKANKKKNKDAEITEALKQQYADYLHTNNGGLDELGDYVNYVPETPELSLDELGENVPQEKATFKDERSVEALPAYSAWFKRANQFELDPRYLKEDLTLIKYDMLDKDLLVLDEPDIVPVPCGWGACLLGRFTGRFPGKEPIFDLMRRWPCKSRVTFHRKGWLCFQFGNDEDMEKARQKGPFDIFGIPLVLQPMPPNFNPDMEPEVMTPVWLRLVDLPLTLWNLTAVSKIASCIGTPLATDYSTLRRDNMDGPRIQVIVDITKRPKKSLCIKLPTGEFEQKIEYEFMPKFCHACKMYGHLADDCRGHKDDWRQGNRGDRGRSKSATRGRPRSKSATGVHQNLLPQRQNGPPNKGHEGGLGHKPPQQRARSRQGNKWIPKGSNVYPIQTTYIRQRDVLHQPDATKPKAVTEAILVSPNKFAILGEENMREPTENQADHTTLPSRPTVQEIIAAVVPPILAGLQSNAALTQRTPFVNNEMRLGKKNRDPRLAHLGDQSGGNVEAGFEVEGITNGALAAIPPKEIVMEGEETGDIRVKTGGKKKQKKAKGFSDGQTLEGPATEDASAAGIGPYSVKDKEAGTDGLEAEASGRHSRSDARNEDPHKRKKSKSRSRSRSKKKDGTPFHWEDGLEDDQGDVQ
ncbi:hypothetical protein AAHA92_01360 [Salvia divinorum]|uniref:DUF4283 domain-containing protein n=1 Tax=Salvia divinorum TaxID=28513 RepID=A0ABD1IQQ6_SALDI